MITAADLDRLDWSKGNGLLPAIIQDHESGAVLMLGYVSPESLDETLKSSHVTFFSRSRQRLWMKGETSGNTLELRDVVADCDSDCLLIKAQPAGPTCHLGTRTCFDTGELTRAERMAFLAKLDGIIEQRLRDLPEHSYTARLIAGGTQHLAQKVGEEAVEVALASVGEDDDALREEAADLLFHLMVLLRHRGMSLEQAVQCLETRHSETKVRD